MKNLLLPVLLSLSVSTAYATCYEAYSQAAEKDIFSMRYNDLGLDFLSLRLEKDTSHLTKLISKSIKKAGLEQSDITINATKDLLLAGYEDNTFCPKVNGVSKVLNRKNLITYVSENLSSALAEIETKKIEALAELKKQKAADAKLIKLLKSNKTFTNYGAITKTSYMPPNSPINNFAYDLYYYIPAKLKGKKDLKAIVFLHGGGASTSDRAGSNRVAKMYIDDLKTIADNLGVVLIAPSGSALNWGGHMINMLKGLTQTIRTELPVNPNKIALTGHSMGGMGITRSAHWLADDFAFFMPVAAGMDERHQTESNLSPYFNMTYYHLQGLQDHFQLFITRCKAQEKNINNLEAKFSKQTGFTVEYYNGAHNYPKQTYQNRLEKLFKTKKRDLYQTDLNGLLYYRDEVRIDQWSNGFEYYLGPRDRYFWIKATEFSEKRKVARIEAQIKNNKISIQVEDAVSKLRVYLSAKNIDLSKSITITVNGNTQFVGNANLRVDTSAELAKDPGYKFESYVDVDVK